MREADGNRDVSVVIPCHDHGEFLAEAVQSALRQAGGPPAVVVVDDGSSDERTAAALEGLPTEVEVVRQANAGAAAARNAGAARTTGPLLLMLDADDRLAPDALATLRPALEGHPDAGYAYGVMRLFGAMAGEVRFPDFDAYRLLYRPIVGSPGTMLLRRSVFDEVRGYDESVPGYEDWDFQLGALERGHAGVRVPVVTLEYRKHGRSALVADRRRHRELFARLRAKHAALYARERELGDSSRLGPLGRLAYRTWWARRPLPTALEVALHKLAFRG